MKKLVSLLLALMLTLGCAAALADNVKMDTLTFQFVPSKDADVIITGTKNLPELVQAEMAKLGYDIGKVEISVGTSYEATGEAMSAGTIDVGWLPGGTYAIYSGRHPDRHPRRPQQRQRKPRRLERRGQQDPAHRKPGDLLPLPDLRRPHRKGQGPGRQGQRR